MGVMAATIRHKAAWRRTEAATHDEKRPKKGRTGKRRRRAGRGAWRAFQGHERKTPMNDDATKDELIDEHAPATPREPALY